MFDFNTLYEPSSVEEAVQMMKEHPEAKIIAGGSDILVQLRGGLFSGIDLISIFMLDELRGIEKAEDGTIKILPLTSFSRLERNPIIREYVPVIGEAAGTVGGPQIRNIGTIGGNICNAHTGGDLVSTVFALDGEVELTGPEEIRRLSIHEFYKPMGGADLHPAELLTAFYFPEKCYKDYAFSYFKYSARNAMDVDIVGCSTNVKLSDDKKTFQDVRVAVGVVGPKPVRLRAAEEEIKGKSVSTESIEKFADMAMNEISPRTDFRGTKELRMHMAHVMIKRTLADAVTKSGGVL